MRYTMKSTGLNKPSLYLSSLLASFCLCGYSLAAQPQVGQVPLVVDQTKTTDNLTVLMAASGALSDGINITTYGGAKAGYVSGLNQTSEYIEWDISLSVAADYRIYGMVSGNGSAQAMSVSVGNSSLSFSTGAHSDFNGWDKVDAGVLSLPAGQSTIRVAKSANDGASINIKSLELLRESDRAAFEQRVQSFRADTTFLSEGKYGIMLQYGHWGYPQTGNKKDIDQQATDFDVNAFVNWVKSTGAGYIVWSATWWTYELNTPSPVVDAILNNGGANTSARDLIGDVATAAENAGLDFVLYYHSGHDVHRTSGYGSTPWWQAQNFPNSFAQRGYGDRSTFFTNWNNVIAELGNKYGTKLDAWFFDDGLVYYPGNFEEMGNAAKAGNPNRLIGYSSSGGLARVTEFQDINFGEACHGESGTGSAPVGGDGIFTAGPEKGLLQHCMFTMEPYTGGADWGIKAPNQVIGDPWVTSQQLTNWVNDASSRNVPLSINFMMYEDGSMSPKSLEVISDFAAARGIVTLNDNDHQITKTGSWSTSSNRGAEDYKDDVSYTSTVGDYIEYNFYGNQIEILGPKDSVNGSVGVTLDTLPKETISTTSSNYLSQQVIYSKSNLLPNKAHTIKLEASSAGYTVLDAIRVHKPIVNNDNTAITYDGSWSHSTARGAGDISDDVHYTFTNGDFFEFSFTGTGVELIAPKDSGDGTFDVFIDNNLVASAVSLNSANYEAASTVYANMDLAPGQHTLKIVKSGGGYVQIDAISYFDAQQNNDDSSISYSGNWGTSSNRNVGDYQNDVNYTSTNNDYAELTFEGTGIDYIGPKGSGYGTFEVLIDNVSQGIYSADASSYSSKQVLFSIRNLSNAQHTIRIIKKSGDYTHLDSLRVYQ